MAVSKIASHGDWVQLGAGSGNGTVNINGKFSDYKMLAFVSEQVADSAHAVSRTSTSPFVVSTSLFKKSTAAYNNGVGGFGFYYISDTSFGINAAPQGLCLFAYGIT